MTAWWVFIEDEDKGLVLRGPIRMRGALAYSGNLDFRPQALAGRRGALHYKWGFW